MVSTDKYDRNGGIAPGSYDRRPAAPYDRNPAANSSAGLSIAQLAQRAGTHATHVGAIERADRNPTLGMLAQIADGLEVELVTLIDLRAAASVKSLTSEVRRRTARFDAVRLREVLSILDAIE